MQSRKSGSRPLGIIVFMPEFMSHTITTVPKVALERAHKEERDASVSRRMLLIVKVKYDGLSQNQAARELRGQSSWAVTWVRRFEEEGTEGLRTRERSGRPPKVEHRIMTRIGREVTASESGWTVKKVRELVREKTDVMYSERHVLRLLHRWGARRVVPEKRLAHRASLEERVSFKRGWPGSSGTSRKNASARLVD